MTYIDRLCNEIYESTKRIKGDMEPGKVLDLNDIKEIVEPIVKLIDEAKEKKMYIYLNCCGENWFTPMELESKLENGYYVFHVSMFKLRQPIERLEELMKEILNKRIEFKKILREVSIYSNENERELEILTLKKISVKEKAGDDVKF